MYDQAQGKLESYEGDQDLEDEHVINIHYFSEYNYIPAENESGAEKLRVISPRRIIQIHP